MMVKYYLHCGREVISREVEGELPRIGETYTVWNEKGLKSFVVLEVKHQLNLGSTNKLEYIVNLSPFKK
jgi:hypothetical protein